MAIFQQSPGSWFSFTKRLDNQNLSINELKSKFYKEQLLFENFVSSQVSQQYLQNNSAQLNNQLHQAGKRYGKQEVLSAVFNTGFTLPQWVGADMVGTSGSMAVSGGNLIVHLEDSWYGLGTAAMTPL